MSKEDKKNAMDDLHTTAVVIEGKYYTVEDFPFDEVDQVGPDALRKGVAYRYETQLTKGLFPYRGIADESFNMKKSKIGIWFKRRHGEYLLRVVLPRTSKEKAAYALGKEKDIVAAVLGQDFAPDQFADSTFSLADIGTDLFIPPMYADDDPLNMLMKMAIRMKSAPFEPYGKRLEALAVDKKHGVEGVNIRNNAKRAIKINTAMSPGKFMQYADTWQLEPAFILRDRSDAMLPILPDGEMLVLYPNGTPFPINNKKLVDVSDMIADAITETSLGKSKDDDDKKESD